ncbi:MAG: S9 family peptidase [Rickettsiales bacterium]|nr:MAG: S9 family peptidase [Rickettsiales bacterium]
MKDHNELPPVAIQEPYSYNIHGQKIEDNYFWMRAKGWPDKVTDSKVLNYLESENKYYQNFMQPLDSEKNELFEELKSRIKLTDQSTYIKKDNYFYYTRTEENKEYTIYCRKKDSIDSQEEILLDVNILAIGNKFTSLGAFSISPDHKLMAYSVNFTGGEKYTIKIFDLESRTFLVDKIENTIGSIIWHEKQNGFFYVPTDKKWRHNKIKFHKLGTDSKDDKIIVHEKDPLYSVGVGKSSSKRYIFINVGGFDTSEIYYIDMEDETLTPKLIKARKDRIQYSIDHGDQYFYQLTNDDAKNFHITRAIADGYNEETEWEIYVPEDKDRYLSSFDITKKYLLLNYKNKGIPESVVKDFENGFSQTVNFPDSAYTADIFSTNYVEDDIRINYSSLSRPTTIYNYDYDSNNLSILKVQEIPGGFDSEQYKVERLHVSHDGVEVPISLFYKKSLFKNDGSNPLFLYGYGSYGISIPPSFRNTAISLVDRGFVYAIAHIRGGDDLGHDWYEAAKFLTKKRSFNDFIAVSEELIKQKYTSIGNIVIAGGSAGGLLIGNVINQRPELFKAAIAHVPFVDIINTMLDENLPLTPGEYKEWGDPKEKEYFEYMKSYSPYDNVSAQAYPHLLVTAGLSDPRVGYWEGAKWVAKLRQLKTDNNLIIFKTNMDAGHTGASGKFDYLKETAEDLVFIFHVFNIKF